MALVLCDAYILTCHNLHWLKKQGGWRGCNHVYGKDHTSQLPIAVYFALIIVSQCTRIVYKLCVLLLLCIHS